MLRDLISHVKTAILFCKTLTATETPSNGIDLKGFGSCLIQCAIGAVTNIANSPQPSWTFKLEESDDDSTYSAVTTDDVLLTYGNNDGAISSGVFATIDYAAEDDTVYTIGYIGTKRYVRVVATAANTPGATPISVVCTLGALQKPQADA